MAGFPFTLITSWDLMYEGTLGNRQRGLMRSVWDWYISRIRELSDTDAPAWQALEVCAVQSGKGWNSMAIANWVGMFSTMLLAVYVQSRPACM